MFVVRQHGHASILLCYTASIRLVFIITVCCSNRLHMHHCMFMIKPLCCDAYVAGSDASVGNFLPIACVILTPAQDGCLRGGGGEGQQLSHSRVLSVSVFPESLTLTLILRTALYTAASQAYVEAGGRLSRYSLQTSTSSISFRYCKCFQYQVKVLKARYKSSLCSCTVHRVIKCEKVMLVLLLLPP